MAAQQPDSFVACTYILNGKAERSHRIDAEEVEHGASVHGTVSGTGRPGMSSDSA